MSADDARTDLAASRLPWTTNESGERYPKGAIDAAIEALEVARPDTREGGVVRFRVDDALDRLYRARELAEGIRHPYRRTP